MPPADEPAPIPRRVAYRLCADVLFSLASRLRDRTPGASGGRRGAVASQGAAAKLDGREEAAGRASAAASALIRLSRDDAACRGPGVDAAALGYLLALLAEWSDARRELAAEMAAGVAPPAMDWRDGHAVAAWVIGGER